MAMASTLYSQNSKNPFNDDWKIDLKNDFY